MLDMCGKAPRGHSVPRPVSMARVNATRISTTAGSWRAATCREKSNLGRDRHETEMCGTKKRYGRLNSILVEALSTGGRQDFTLDFIASVLDHHSGKAAGWLLKAQFGGQLFRRNGKRWALEGPTAPAGPHSCRELIRGQSSRRRLWPRKDYEAHLFKVRAAFEARVVPGILFNVGWGAGEHSRCAGC